MENFNGSQICGDCEKQIINEKAGLLNWLRKNLTPDLARKELTVKITTFFRFKPGMATESHATS